MKNGFSCARRGGVSFLKWRRFFLQWKPYDFIGWSVYEKRHVEIFLSELYEKSQIFFSNCKNIYILHNNLLYNFIKLSDEVRGEERIIFLDFFFSKNVIF